MQNIDVVVAGAGLWGCTVARTLADFVLIQVGWLTAELHYATTRRLAATRGHLDFRRRFLHELAPGEAPWVDELCNLAAAALRVNTASACCADRFCSG